MIATFIDGKFVDKAENIPDWQILTRHLGYKQVAEDKIGDLAVTGAKLANGAVTSAKFATDDDTKRRTRRIFVQASAPTSGMSDGDIWIKPASVLGSGWFVPDSIKVYTAG